MHNARTVRSGRWAVSAAMLAALAGVSWGQPATLPNTSARPQPGGPTKITPGAPRQPAGTQPAAQPSGQPKKPGEVSPLTPTADDADMFTLQAFSEPVELSTLVEWVSNTLNLNLVVKGTLNGTVAFNTPVSVPKSRLLKLLDSLLEQQGFTITYDADSQFYTVHPVADVVFNTGGEQPSTRVIPTPNVRPSYLKPAIDSQFFGGTGGAQGGVPGQPGGTQISKGVAYVDELGVIVVTETPRRVSAIEELVRTLLATYGTSEFIRIDLKYVAAPQARFRALQLVGQSTGPTGGGINPQTGEVQQNQGMQFGQSRGMDNLGDRLIVDSLGNSLIFRGTNEEISQVQKLVSIIDAPNSLKPHNYFVGSRAKQVSDIATYRGLGEVALISAPQQSQGGQNFPIFTPGFDPQSQSTRKATPSAGGPVMVIDEKNGTIVYYGTEEQQTQLAALIDELKVEDERVVIREYKLKHSDAEKVADLVLNLIQNTKPVGTSDLLGPGGSGAAFGGGGSTSRTQYRPSNRQNQPATGSAPGAGGAGGGSESEGLQINGEETFVLADVSNNQVLVKAPAREQKEFARLLERLDQRRPQVYIEAKIIAVTAGDEFRLAFEQQLINANGTGGVFNTNFGLSTLPTTGSQPILTPKTVATGLSGFTAALIKSDQVPLIITALARDTSTRILSTPQLLVDDNEEASVVSVQQQPTTTTTQTQGNPSQTSFGEYVEAGTKFIVTPHISSGGYLRMDYEINLSSFDGTGNNGIPPPKLDNTLKSKSVAVPGNMTVVLGGLVLDSKQRTVVKVPLLGDIPIVGALFRDDNKNDRQTTLYVFLTPKILQDPSFDDYALIAKGPQAAVNLPLDTPTLKPSMIELIEAAPHPAPVAPAPAPAPTEPAAAPTEPAVPLIDVPAPSGTPVDDKGFGRQHAN